MKLNIIVNDIYELNVIKTVPCKYAENIVNFELKFDSLIKMKNIELKQFRNNELQYKSILKTNKLYFDLKLDEYYTFEIRKKGFKTKIIKFSTFNVPFVDEIGKVFPINVTIDNFKTALNDSDSESIFCEYDTTLKNFKFIMGNTIQTLPQEEN